MENQKWTNYFNYNERRRPNETFSLPSMTIPDAVEPIQSLYLKHLRGQAVPEYNVYYDNSDMPDLNRMDKVHRTAYVQAMRAEHERLMQEATRPRPEPEPEPPPQVITAPE